MPKLSVYIADDLWRSAVELDARLRGASTDAAPDTGRAASHLIQDLLRSWLATAARRPAYAKLSPELLAKRERALAEASRKLAGAYQAGYATGLDLSRELPWEAWHELARLDWDLAAWRAWLDDAELPLVAPAPGDEDRVFDFAEAWERLGEQHLGSATGSEPAGPVAEGLRDAFRDLWQVAETGDPAIAVTAHPEWAKRERPTDPPSEVVRSESPSPEEGDVHRE